MKIIDAVQECSGLVILISHAGEPTWIRPPEKGVSRELAERLIEEQGVRVAGRMQ